MSFPDTIIVELSLESAEQLVRCSEWELLLQAVSDPQARRDLQQGHNVLQAQVVAARLVRTP